MIDILARNPLLLLFVVVAIGYPLGRLRVWGTSFGVAAILFVGLAFGALSPELKLPEIVYSLGLVLFVYALGLGSGPGFFGSFRRQGLRDSTFAVGLIVFAALCVVGIKFLLHLNPALAAGMFTGSLTNTPALAGLLDWVTAYAPPAMREAMLAEPVVGYTLAYPMGVVGGIVAIAVVQRLWKVDYAAEARRWSERGAVSQKLQNRTIRVTHTAATGLTLHEIAARDGMDVAFGRVQRAGRLSIPVPEAHFEVGDLVSLIGPREALDRVTTLLGESTDARLELDRSEFDYRRMFVSNPQVVGHTLKDLDLPQQFGAIVTRVRRGDIEMLAREDTLLELGDRVRVVTRRENMAAVSAFFGDSYRALSEIDILTFSLGLALGTLLGMLPIPLPGGVSFRLGLAGGPLLVALVLGHLGRTGPMVWSLPYSASLTLRQIGLILFLAGVGTRSGHGFVTTLAHGGGLAVLLAGAVVTVLTAVAALWIGRRFLRLPMGLLIGMLAGVQTQPAVLGFAVEQTHDDLPNVGYARVYPIATIAKILVAQVILSLLQ